MENEEDTRTANVFIRTYIGQEGIGLLDKATIMIGGSKLEHISKFSERGCGQPGGIEEDEAFALGERVGKYLKSIGITRFNLIEGDGESMEENPKLWYSGDLADYECGINQVLNRGVHSLAA